MKEEIANKSIILLMSVLENRITYTGKQIKETQPSSTTATKVFIDDLGVLEEKPTFEKVKLAVMKFKNKLSGDSSLFGSFFEDTQESKRRHANHYWVYDYKNDYAVLKEGLSDSDEIELFVLESQCIGSITGDLTREIEEIKTSCGTKKAIKPDKTWNLSLSGWYQRFSEKEMNTSLSALMLSSNMDMTIERKSGLRTIKKSNLKEFLFFSLFMDLEGEGSLEGWVVFTGQMANASFGQTTDSGFQAYTANIANKSEPYIALNNYGLMDYSDKLNALSSAVKSGRS